MNVLLKGETFTKQPFKYIASSVYFVREEAFVNGLVKYFDNLFKK